ncbi:MAG: RNB domain-containing ribonuclease, partial [Phycisphaerales bacterium]|nr:RNB domain-containing ribonuclease [Phycisphaerales bacterium]
MPLRYKARLIQHMRHEDYTPSTVASLAEVLRIDDLDDFAAAIDELKSRGIVSVDDKGKVSLPSVVKFGREIVGTIKVTSRGFAFVTPRETVKEGDIFIPPGSTMDAMTGDEVVIEVRRDRKRERHGSFQSEQFVGEVVEILKRKRAAFTGTVFKQGSLWLVAPDGKLLTDPIVVRDAESKNVKENDKVVVDILEYPEGGALAEGVISKVLGEAGQPDVETQAVIAAYDLPGEFDDDCLDQAREITQRFDEELDRWKETGELEQRADITGEYILTIDPPDAKDYDDAISVRRLDDGWELGVHIADVGHFIDPGTPLDVEAIRRGNSVYLPRLVI